MEMNESNQDEEHLEWNQVRLQNRMIKKREEVLCFQGRRDVVM